MSPARIGVVVAAVLAVGVLYRVLLAMERRGWIYYRTRGSASAGVTLGVLDEVFHPSGRVSVVEREEQDQRGQRRAVPGDPPDPPAPPVAPSAGGS